MLTCMARPTLTSNDLSVGSNSIPCRADLEWGRESEHTHSLTPVESTVGGTSDGPGQIHLAHLAGGDRDRCRGLRRIWCDDQRHPFDRPLDHRPQPFLVSLA